MEARLLPMGRSALLVEVRDTDAALALRAHLAPRVAAADGVWSAVEQLVVGARTVLVVLRDPALADDVATACLDVASALDESADLWRADQVRRVVEVPVRYDGPDLDEVAALTGLTREEVVLAHTGTPWRVGFGGFAPGFAYLVDGDPRLRVARRHEPRTTVPAGSVALAGEFSGIYPHESPGGWRLLGTTRVVLWDVERDPPALLAPGDAVHFVEVDAPRPRPVEWPRRPTTTRAIRRGAAGRRHQGRRQSDRAGAGGARDRAADARRGPRPARLRRRRGGPLGRSRPGGIPARSASRRARPRRTPREGAATPASLEVTLGGLSVRARGDLLVALTGAPCPADVDGAPCRTPHPSRSPTGRC